MSRGQAWNFPIKPAITVWISLSLWIRHVDADGATWNYNISGLGSPQNWYKDFPNCGGVMQSPIDINTSIVLYDPWLPLFDISDYSLTNNVNMKLKNKGGHTAEVEFSGTHIYLRGGGLPDIYKLVQFHFHWGGEDQRGSEHSIDGYHAPMELHLVHQQVHLENDSYYNQHPFAIAVFGFMLRISDKDNPAFDHLLKYFPLISTADNETDIETFKVRELLPPDEKLYFYRYSGSLTTPPCYETVIWSVATQFIDISERQIEVFRNLHDEDDHRLVDDFRPLQLLNQRSILTNDDKFKATIPQPTSQPCDGNSSGQKWTSHNLVYLISLILSLYGLM